MSPRLNRFQTRWRNNFRRIDFLLSVLIGVEFTVWVIWAGGASVVQEFLGGNRAAIYGTLSTLFGSLLGFIIVAVSIVLGLVDNPRLRLLRDAGQVDTLWEVFEANIRALALATLVSLVALVVDRGPTPNLYLLGFLAFAFSLAFLRVSRSVWVLEEVMKKVTKDSSTGEGIPGARPAGASKPSYRE